MLTTIRVAIPLILALVAAGATAVAQSAPGETSGAPLASLLVESYDPATDTLTIIYQSGCDAENNNLYSGPLDQVSSHAWDSERCSIGSLGRLSGYDPGAGNRFFVAVGHRDNVEGSYGLQTTGPLPTQRPPHTTNTCGEGAGFCRALSSRARESLVGPGQLPALGPLTKPRTFRIPKRLAPRA